MSLLRSVRRMRKKTDITLTRWEFALYSKIDSLQREDHFVTVAEVKEVMDDAIRHSQKASAKKLMRKVFGRNTDESDRIILSEKDFNI